MSTLDLNNRSQVWLAVDIANQMGYDKLKFPDRVKWVNENIDLLESFQDTAESPWEFRNSCNALRQEMRGIKSDNMVYLDASNQALQLYAVLTADKQTASTCNLANGDEMADAYQMLADALNNELETDIFNRKSCKKSLMTTMYAKMKAYNMILVELYPSKAESIEAKHHAMAKKLNLYFDEDIQECKEFGDAFETALRNIAPMAIATMEEIQKLNNKEIGTYNWTLPDGFKVKYDVKNEQSISGERHSRNGIKLSFNATKIVYEPSEFNRGMSPNIIHSVDGWVAREMIRRMNGKFITTIHDAFACRAEDCDLMRKNYQDIMVEILHSDLLQDIMSQIAGHKVPSLKVNTLTEDDIRNSVYFLG